MYPQPLAGNGCLYSLIQSALLDYLKLCEEGFSIFIDVLEDTITKESTDCWSHADWEESGLLTSLEVLEMVRVAVIENDSECDVDKIFIEVETRDDVSVKREVVAAAEAAEEEGEEDEEAEGAARPKVGMKLAEIIDISDDSRCVLLSHDSKFLSLFSLVLLT